LCERETGLLPDQRLSEKPPCLNRMTKKGKLTTMQLTLPAPLEQRLTPRATALHLAVGLFVSEEATLGQAAEVAGLSQVDFLRELGRRHIPMHYGMEELAEDLKAVESLASR